MMQALIETTYPITFRKDQSEELGIHIKNRSSVALIGMRKVGISNFLRFFLNHKDISSYYIKDNKQHFFILVDLNDLVEREIAPFWTLTLKRILDEVEKSLMDEKIKKEIRRMFLESIQLQDTFITIENVRHAIKTIESQGYLPTLFFLRFDRLKDAVNPEFFAILEGIKSTNPQVAFIFTSFQPLNVLFPSVLPKTSWGLFFKNIYVPPAKKEDIKIIFEAYIIRFGSSLPIKLGDDLFEIVDGYTQYLQLALIILHENKRMFKSKEEILQELAKDERINLQSDELWESLDKTSQEVLSKIVNDHEIYPEDKKKAAYLWDTGFIKVLGKSNQIFSILFKEYVKQKQSGAKEANSDFSKKENLLFQFLMDNKDKICERDQIAQAVWPEEEELGISDWAIDKLVARVRNKLKLQNNNFEIQTIKTRGYKLTEG